MAFPKKRASSPAVNIPRLEDDPDYADLLTRRTELTRRRADTQLQLDRLYHPDEAEGATSDRAARAALLLGNSSPPTLEANGRERSDRMKQLRSDLEDLDTALEILRQRLTERRREVSRVIAETVRPTHESNIRALALSIATTLEAYRRYRALTAQLNDHDVAWSSHLVQPASLHRILGELNDTDTPAHRFVADAIAAGIVTDSDVEGVRDGQ